MRMCQISEVLQGSLLRETHHFEVRGVGTNDGRRLRGNGLLIIAQAGPIRRAYLDHDRPTLRHHIGYAERPADLD